MSVPQPRPPSGSALPRWRLISWFAILGLVFAWWWLSQQQPRDTMAYSTFREHVRQGRVKRVTIEGEQISGALAAKKSEPRAGEPQQARDEGQPQGETPFVTYLPAPGDAKLIDLLEKHGVTVATRPTQRGSGLILLLTLAPLLLILGLGFLFYRNLRSQGRSLLAVKANRARLYEQRDEKTTFDDVAGAREAKTELAELVDFLAAPARFARMGGKIPKGALLIGPPGTGKTLLARAVAGEAGVPFFSITGSDFMELFVGVGASRVRSMFAEAKRRAPCIIFIDEIDSVGRRRGAGLGGGHDEREQTLNQLLSELDGFEPNEGVIVLAATNRPDILDPALLRAGRFDRRISVDQPSIKDRAAILAIHARGKPLAEHVDLAELARATPGFSGADLENLLNEAALLAARERLEAIEPQHVSAARDKMMLGLAREGLDLSDDECRTLAYHEVGHAVVAALLPETDPLYKVSIVPRGPSMGATSTQQRHDRYIHTRAQLVDQLAVMMGGRAAERALLGVETTGAADDLARATDLARRMVIELGMSERLGLQAYAGRQQSVFLGHELASERPFSEETARQIDHEVRELLQQAFHRASGVLQANRVAVEHIASELRAREELTGEQIAALLDERGAIKPRPADGEPQPLSHVRSIV